MKPLFLRASLFSAIALLVSSPMSMAELVVDGNFTAAGVTSSYKTYSLYQKFGPWQVSSQNVDLVTTFWQSPPGGGNSVDLNGTRSGKIRQTIATEAGVEYTLTFQMTGNWRGGGSTKDLQVSIGGNSHQFAYTRPSGWSLSNMLWKEVSVAFTGTGGDVVLEFASREPSFDNNGPVIGNVSIAPARNTSGPPALDTVTVPLPSNLNDFVKDKDAAILLGKSLFWDMQVGGDGMTACGSCHFQAGADNRTVNKLGPGAPGGAFGPERDGQAQLAQIALANFRGTNKTLTKGDFPFHKVQFPTRKGGDSNPVISDTKEINGSQGVIKKRFVNINEGNPNDSGILIPDDVFNVDGVNSRQVTSRNAPTTINAVFFDRQFWDGRAQAKFNGANPFGDLDTEARIWEMKSSNTFEDQLQAVFAANPWAKRFERLFRKYTYLVRWFLGTGYTGAKSLHQVRVLIDHASLASQAVGPVLSPVEESWMSRSFPEVGRKMFSLPPLALQPVHPDDSVLGPYANEGGLGLKSDVNYARLVREAFHEKWWGGDTTTPDGYTQMEANFSLYWGLALNLYQSTLVSDQSPYDAYAKGDTSALSDLAKRGLDIFLNEGKCINCHGGAEFAGGTVSDLFGGGDVDGDGVIELMLMQQGPAAYYDGGYYNIGVRPTIEDLGVGASHPQFGPLSYTRQRQNGRDVGQNVTVRSSDRVAVDGAFKASSLRNIELTGPYMHNGGMKSLKEVVQFYTRRADFFKENIQDLDPDVDGISELQGNPEDINAVVEFMKALTDDRVRYKRAPFDHPGLMIPNGVAGIENGVALDNVIYLEPVGRDGGAPLQAYEDILTGEDNVYEEPPVSNGTTEPAAEEPAAGGSSGGLLGGILGGILGW